MKRFLLFAALVSLALSAGTPAAAQLKYQFSHLKIDEPDSVRDIRIIWNIGDIEVISSNRPRISFTAREDAMLHLLNGYGLNNRTPDDTLVTIRRDGRHIDLIQRETTRKVYLRLLMPSIYNLQIENLESGNVSVEDILGELTLSCHAGDITLEDIKGPVSASTQYGSISASFFLVFPDNPMFFTSFYDNIEISIPEQARTNFILNTPYQSFVTNLDLKPVAEELSAAEKRRELLLSLSDLEQTLDIVKEKGGEEYVESQRIGLYVIPKAGSTRLKTFSLNGGGVPITLSTEYGVIRLLKRGTPGMNDR